MTALNKAETWLLRRLLKKMISGDNGQQMALFSELHAIDKVVHYEDNEPTRLHWYQKWFELAFAPPDEMGRRTPRLGSRVFYSLPLNPLGRKYGRVVGIVVRWEDGPEPRTTAVTSSSMIDVVD